jgi:uncharacterized protein (TIGR02588 family)
MNQTPSETELTPDISHPSETNQSSAAADSPDTYPPRSPAEWISFSIASFILAIVVGLAGYLWLGQEQNQEPPDLHVSTTQGIRQSSGQFYVPFKIENIGGQTAESVQVIAELRINGTVAEEGEQLIDFLASHELEEGAFIFTRDPQAGELTVRVASYKLP